MACKRESRRPLDGRRDGRLLPRLGHQEELDLALLEIGERTVRGEQQVERDAPTTQV